MPDASPGSIEIPIDTRLAPELDEDTSFGPDATGPGAIVEGGFVAVVGNQPIAFRLRDVFAQLGRPAESKLYNGFDVWLVPHRVSIVRRSGLAEPTSVGLEVEYLTEGATCSVAALFPSFEYAVHGSVGGQVMMTGALSPVGVASGEAPASTQGPAAPGEVAAGNLRLSASGGTDLQFKFQLSVATPYVTAAGLGSSHCEWQFQRRSTPLFGRDIETWAAVVVAKGRRQLRHRVRTWLVTRTLFVPTRRESDWTELEFYLATGREAPG